MIKKVKLTDVIEEVLEKGSKEIEVTWEERREISRYLMGMFRGEITPEGTMRDFIWRLEKDGKMGRLHYRML